MLELKQDMKEINQNFQWQESLANLILYHRNSMYEVLWYSQEVAKVNQYRAIVEQDMDKIFYAAQVVKRAEEMITMALIGLQEHDPQAGWILDGATDQRPKIWIHQN